MNAVRVVAGTVFACALVCAGVAAAPVATTPSSVRAYSGAKIVTSTAPGTPLVGMQLFIRAGLDRQTPGQSGMAALTAECILGTTVGTPAQPLRDAVLAQGGSITYTVDGGWIRFYAEGLRATFAAGILPLFESALRAPDFSAAHVALARAELNRKIAENEKIPFTVGMEMLNAAFFTDSDAGLPQYGLPATLAGFAGSDLQQFFRTYYRRDGAVLSADGGTDAVPASAFTTLLDVFPPGATKPVPIKIARLHGTERRLVTHRDIGVPWLVAQFPAPAVGSRDFGAMLVLTAFLDRTVAEVAENPTVTTRPFSDRAVGTLYNFDERPASVVLFINGGFGDPTRPFNTALSVIQIFAHSKLSGDIGTMKSIAAGSFVDGANSLEDRAWLAGVFAEQDLSPDFIEQGLRAISGVKAADLQRVARTYLENPNVAIVLPRDTPSS